MRKVVSKKHHILVSNATQRLLLRHTPITYITVLQCMCTSEGKSRSCSLDIYMYTTHTPSMTTAILILRVKIDIHTNIHHTYTSLWPLKAMDGERLHHMCECRVICYWQRRGRKRRRRRRRCWFKGWRSSGSGCVHRCLRAAVQACWWKVFLCLYERDFRSEWG